jgi:hypothetical protein
LQVRGIRGFVFADEFPVGNYQERQESGAHRDDQDPSGVLMKLAKPY